MKRLASLGLSLFLALGVAGCVAGHKVGGTSLSAHVDDDAVQLNEAHTRTINGVITLNILRARDNWPTGYTTLSGITFSPELQTNANLGLSPLGLGNPVNPFGKSNSSFSRSRASDAKYSVNPFAEKPGASGLYKIEASEELFQRYIDSGWPIEVVFPLFIRRVEIDAPSDAPFNDRSCDIFGDHEFARRLGATFATAAPHRAISDPKTNTSSPACTAVIESIFLGSATTTGHRPCVARQAKVAAVG